MKRGILLLCAATLLIPKTDARGSNPTCFGQKPSYIGSSGEDSVYLDVHNRVAVTKGGVDYLKAPTDEDYHSYTLEPLYGCGGDGNDHFVGRFRKISGDGGYDVAYISACVDTEIRKIEKVVLIPCEGPDR